MIATKKDLTRVKSEAAKIFHGMQDFDKDSIDKDDQILQMQEYARKSMEFIKNMTFDKDEEISMSSLALYLYSLKQFKDGWNKYQMVSKKINNVQ